MSSSKLRFIPIKIYGGTCRRAMEYKLNKCGVADVLADWMGRAMQLDAAGVARSSTVTRYGNIDGCYIILIRMTNYILW